MDQIDPYGANFLFKESWALLGVWSQSVWSDSATLINHTEETRGNRVPQFFNGMCFVTHRSVAQDPFNFIFSLSAGDGHCGLMTIGANAAEPNTKHGKWLLVIASTHGAFITGKGRSAHKCAESLAKSCKGNGPNMAQQLLAMANWRAEMKETTVGFAHDCLWLFEISGLIQWGPLLDMACILRVLTHLPIKGWFLCRTGSW